MAGRKCKLNKEIQDKIIDLLLKGNYIETAAACAGISKNTLYDWLKRGAREAERIEKGGNPNLSERKFVLFSDAVDKAMADAEARDVNLLFELSEEDVGTLKWRLAHRYPDRWGRKERHEITGKDGGPIEIDPKEVLLHKISQMADNEDDEE